MPNGHQPIFFQENLMVQTTTDQLDICIGERLRLARKKCGFSQTKVGKAIGVSYQQIQKFEKGINRLSVSCLIRLSKFLNVPIVFFFENIPLGYSNQYNDVSVKLLHSSSSRKKSK
jgi:transcriptional regulator with XRE-family HTH domain